MTHTKTAASAATVDPSTYDGLIKDLADIFGKANKADDDLNKAKEKHKGAGDQSIRAVAARIAGINHPLPPEAIEAIAGSVGDKLSGGNANVKKSRKSEIKLLLEQRTHVAQVLVDLDVEVAKRGKDDKPINIRQAALSCLRAIKSKSSDLSHVVDAKSAVKDLVAALDAEPVEKTDADRAEDMFRKLANMKALQVDDGVGNKTAHPVLEAFTSAVLAALGGDPEPLEALRGGMAPEPRLSPEDAVLAAVGVALSDQEFLPPAEEATPISVAPVEKPAEKPQPESSMSVEDVLADIVNLV